MCGGTFKYRMILKHNSVRGIGGWNPEAPEDDVGFDFVADSAVEHLFNDVLSLTSLLSEGCFGECLVTSS